MPDWKPAVRNTRQRRTGRFRTAGRNADRSRLAKPGPFGTDLLRSGTCRMLIEHVAI